MKFRIIPMLLLALVLSACNLPGTNTPVPPTNTSIPPTETPLPPTETPMPPTETPISFGSPVIGWVPNQFQMFNSSEGWGTADGYLLHSIDGGATWVDMTPAEIAGTGASLNLGYLNPQSLWVMASSFADLDNGRLLRTLDGGASWQGFDVPFGSAILEVVDQNQLFAFAYYGAAAGSSAVALWGSTNGGANWSLLADGRPNESLPDALSFSGQKTGLTAVDAQHIFYTGEIPMDGFTYVYASTDGGTTWTQETLPLEGAYANAMTVFYPPVFFTSTQGLIYAHLYTASQTYLGFYTTVDAGQTWTFNGATNVLGSVAIANAQDIFIYDGTTFTTSHDSGASWISFATDLPAGPYPYQMQFLDAMNGWVVVDPGSSAYQIYRTIDGGHTWHLLAEAGG